MVDDFAQRVTILLYPAAASRLQISCLDIHEKFISFPYHCRGRGYDSRQGQVSNDGCAGFNCRRLYPMLIRVLPDNTP